MAISKNEEVIEVIKNMMMLWGTWPKQKRSFYYNLKKFISVIMPLFFVILIYDQLMKNRNYIDKLTDVLCLFASYVSYLIKLAIFSSKTSTFFSILQQLNQKTFINYPNEFAHYVENTIKISKYVARLYQLSCLIVIVSYVLKPWLIPEGQRLPVEVAFDVGNYYYVIYIFQSLSLLIGAWNNSSMDALAMDLMSIAAAQLDILKDKLLQLNVYCEDNVQNDLFVTVTIERKIKESVIHHMDIIRYVENVEDVFSYSFFVQFLDSIAVICTIGFQVAHASSVQLILMLFYFVAMIIQLSLYCWFGNDIIVKSEIIKDACYNLNWYNLNVSIRKSLFIIMERSKRPLRFTAGKFATLSLISFMAIIRSSYSFFALMQKLYLETQHALLHNKDD